MDIIELGMAVDSSQINEAAAATKELGVAWAKAVATIVAEENRLERAMKASAEVQAAAQSKVFGASAQADLQKWFSAQRTRLSMMKESERIAQQQAISEAKLTQELVRQRDAAIAASTASAKAYQSQIGSRLGLSSNATESGAGYAAIDAELERLALKYDKAYAASKLFEAQQKELNFAMLNGAGNAETLKLEMSKLEAEYAAFQGGTAQLGNRFNMLTQATEQSRKGVNRWGLLVQQTGYQAGDFLVQIQSGTNAFVAFGQQATQLVGILPSFYQELGMSALALGGITLGLSIVIPLVTALGAYFTRTAKDSKKAVDEIQTHINALSSTIDSLHLENIKIGFKVDEDSVAQVREDMIKAQMDIAKDTLRINQLNGIGGRATAFVGISQEQVDAQQKIIDDGQKLLDQLEAEKEARRILAGQGSAAAAVQAKLVADKTEELRKIKEQATAQQVAADKATYLKNVFHAMAGETSAVSVSLSGWPGKLNAALGPASALANYLAKASAGAGMMGRGLPAMPGGPVSHGVDGIIVGNGSDTPGGVKPQSKPDFSQFEDMGSSGGTGGSSATTIENKLQDLYKYLDATKQINKYLVDEEDIAYKQREDLLKSALDKKLITLQDYQTMEVDLTRRHQEELAKIEASRQNTQLQDTATFFGGLAAVAQAGGDKMTRVARVFSAAQALTNSYLAFTQVLADPSLVGRPWARFGMAASALASGLQAVAAIKSGSSGSISSHGSVGTSSSASAPAPQQVLIQGLKPTDMFSGEQLSTLFDSLYKENRNRGMVFMVQR